MSAAARSSSWPTIICTVTLDSLFGTNSEQTGYRNTYKLRSMIRSQLLQVICMGPIDRGVRMTRQQASQDQYLKPYTYAACLAIDRSIRHACGVSALTQHTAGRPRRACIASRSPGASTSTPRVYVSNDRPSDRYGPMGSTTAYKACLYCFRYLASTRVCTYAWRTQLERKCGLEGRRRVRPEGQQEWEHPYDQSDPGYPRSTAIHQPLERECGLKIEKD